MKVKTIIFITVIATLLFAYSGLKIYNYTTSVKQESYDSGYQAGSLDGLTYTQRSGGNIVYVDNSTGNATMQETTVTAECNKMIQQQGATQ